MISMITVEELAAEVAVLRVRVASSESVLAIQALKARYGELVDQRFSRGEIVDAVTLADVADETAALFTVDGIWDGGPGLGRAIGRAAIATRPTGDDAHVRTSFLHESSYRR